MAAIGIQHLALGIALAVISAGCSSWRPPVVVKVARTINNAETISSKDYERLREVTEEAIDHIKGVDPHIRPQLTLSSQKNFVDEIADQTRSGRCIRWNGPPPRTNPPDRQPHQSAPGRSRQRSCQRLSWRDAVGSPPGVRR